MHEFRLLSHIFRHNVSLGPRISIPPGDDMAMISLSGHDLLAAVDQVVDGRHFILESTPIELVGRKAMTRSLSDIAAMAARPVASLAAAVLPSDFAEERAAALFDAMRNTAEQYRCPLIGGDIATAEVPLTCSVTVLAEPGPRGVVRRSGARVGDLVCVTGLLGGSREAASGGGRHLTFEPRIDLALALTEILDLRAIIDLSDGLGRDAGHIAKMSNVSIILDADALPLNPGCDWRHAVGDGEDYELCFTVAAGSHVPPSLLDVPITIIGRVEPCGPQGPAVFAKVNDELIDISRLGWEHGQ